MKSRFPAVRSLFLAFALSLSTVQILTAETVWLDELNLNDTTQEVGDPQQNKSIGGGPITIGGKKFTRGFGTHAKSILRVNVEGGEKFTASVGVDDDVNKNTSASLEFIVQGDDKVLFKSGVMRAGEPAKEIDVPLAGVKILTLEVTDGGDGDSYDHADWGEARFDMLTGKPATVPTESALAYVAPYILTPPAPKTPRINGPKVFGVRPGSPFLYTIPATGDRPMEFSAKSLPMGLKLDPKTGRITGALTAKGESNVIFVARNALGTAEKKFRIVCGDTIALTPPMGWNSWNCFAWEVTEERVRSAADALVKSGLVNHGWTYINVDDFWQNHRDSKDASLQGPVRDKDGRIVPNLRFPDMKGMADYIHSLGLKAGLYSSPGPWTCGGCAGSWQHEEIDAKTYAEWGYDYLKYDWCSYGEKRLDAEKRLVENKLYGANPPKNAEAVAPYEIMGKHLAAQKRDILFSLCQYGSDEVWKWGGTVHGSAWRTTGDIVDTWRSMSKIGFRQERSAPYSKPGNWNDPDMLIVGHVGWGKPHPTNLSTDEQYTHISLWSLLASPLLIGCDMTKLDDFTLSLLTNDEVIAVDQDPLGKGAICVLQEGKVQVYQKELEGGEQAIGFFNVGTTNVQLDFKQLAKLGLTGKQKVRDLWRQKDIVEVDATNGTLPLTIPAHGVLLYKFTGAR